MEFFYSNILPLRLSEGQKTIVDCFNELLSKANSVEIAVGYVSYASLCELENLMEMMKLLIGEWEDFRCGL